jgi:hypothetical protein
LVLLDPGPAKSCLFDDVALTLPIFTIEIDAGDAAALAHESHPF